MLDLVEVLQPAVHLLVDLVDLGVVEGGSTGEGELLVGLFGADRGGGVVGGDLVGCVPDELVAVEGHLLRR